MGMLREVAQECRRATAATTIKLKALSPCSVTLLLRCSRNPCPTIGNVATEATLKSHLRHRMSILRCKLAAKNTVTTWAGCEASHACNK